MKNKSNNGVGFYSAALLLFFAAGSSAQTVNGGDNGLPLNNPDSRHQSLKQKLPVLRSKYKGPKSGVPNSRKSKNHAYSLMPTATPKGGPMTFIHHLTPVPTLAPLVPKDAKGNPITLWAPGKRIPLPNFTPSK